MEGRLVTDLKPFFVAVIEEEAVYMKSDLRRNEEKERSWARHLIVVLNLESVMESDGH